MSANLKTTSAKIKTALNSIAFSGKDYYCGAIITAAGSSTRMNAKSDKPVSKQLELLSGNPVISYSLNAFDKSSYCKEIVVTAKEDEITEINRIIKLLSLQTKTIIVAGGKNRSDSVRNGLKALSKSCAYISIHDGARPLILTEDINKLYEKAFLKGCACAATKVNDTVKRADKNNIIIETVDRNELFLVQTPQVFSRDVYYASIAVSKGQSYTDDCGLVENAGFKIPLVNIGNENIKLTYREDFHLAEAILNHRKLCNSNK